jgi:hypothetical protein
MTRAADMAFGEDDRTDHRDPVELTAEERDAAFDRVAERGPGWAKLVSELRDARAERERREAAEELARFADEELDEGGQMTTEALRAGLEERQRQETAAFERARVSQLAKRLAEQGATPEQVAEAVDAERATIRSTMAILDADPLFEDPRYRERATEEAQRGRMAALGDLERPELDWDAGRLSDDAIEALVAVARNEPYAKPAGYTDAAWDSLLAQALGAERS